MRICILNKIIIFQFILRTSKLHQENYVNSLYLKGHFCSLFKFYFLKIRNYNRIRFLITDTQRSVFNNLEII